MKPSSHHHLSFSSTSLSLLIRSCLLCVLAASSKEVSAFQLAAFRRHTTPSPGSPSKLTQALRIRSTTPNTNVGLPILPTHFGAASPLISPPLLARRRVVHAIARRYKTIDDDDEEGGSLEEEEMQPASSEEDPRNANADTNATSSSHPYRSKFYGAYAKMRTLRHRVLTRANRTEPTPTIVVTNVHELRDAVFARKIPLKEVGFNLTPPAVNITVAQTERTGRLLNHSVMELVAERMRTNSTPGNRAANDGAHLALAIEGGGMRGSVSAGMAAAIASLGLSDAFDSVYGSSAGSIVGAYMISRQMCLDVYTEVLPAAKGRFASKSRVIGNIGVGYVNDLVSRRLRTGNGNNGNGNNGNAPLSPPVVNEASRTDALPGAGNGGDTAGTSQGDDDLPTTTTGGRLSTILSKVGLTVLTEKVPILLSSIRPYLTLSPGMNISFVLDGIMNEQHGLRPFDISAFRINDAKQPLMVVSSTVRGGKLETVAFNSRERDYWDVEEDLAEEEIVLDSRAVFVAKAVKRRLVAVAQLPSKAVRRTRHLLRRFIGRKKEEKVATEKKSKAKAVPIAGRKALFGLVPTRRRRSRMGEEEKKKHAKKKTKIRVATSCPDNPDKKGLFACLETSMLVPGAAGAPVKLLRSKHRKTAKTFGVGSMTNTCFDAFCYEPIPYRSAVENGATHVMALRTRPDGCSVETVPATYEKLVAPVYFRINGLPEVVEFFESGGSQYRYLEDVLTLDEGLSVGCTSASSPDFKGVKVPPTQILFGTDEDDDLVVDTDSWKRAHLLPVILPAGTPELPALTQEKDEVLLAVRNGYAAAFDILAPIAGLDFDPSTVDSKRVAELIFPRSNDGDMDILENPIQVKGEVIENYEQEEKARRRFVAWIARKRKARREAKEKTLRSPIRAVAVEVERESPDTKQYVKDDSLDWLEAEALLAALPGFQEGKLSHLSGGLRLEENTGDESEARDEAFA